ncbi:MAG: hypothetical protein ABI196_06740 [Bradyrhizobium sp.]
MRVAVIVVSILMAGMPSEASESCLSMTEARQHFGLVHIYWHGADHCWDASPGRRQPHLIHKVAAKPDQPKWRDAMSEMVPDANVAQMPWLDRWVDIKPSELPLAARWVDIPQATPSPTAEPMATRLAVVLLLALLAIALTLAIIEVLPRGTIYRRQ